MKKILVPTDFSQNAQWAFQLAVEIAQISKGEVLLLHMADLPVVADPVGVSMHSYLAGEGITEIQETLRAKLSEFRNSVKTSVAINEIVEWGNIFSGIQEHVASQHIDLIIMGSKGASGIKEILIGSNTEKIVRNSRVPVLTVKEETHISDIKNIVVGVDLNEDAPEINRQITELSDFIGAQIHVVRINTPANFKRDAEVWPLLKNWMKKNFPEGTEAHIYNDVYEDLGLIHFAEKINADMIALGTHGKRGMQHFISGSIAEDIVNHAKRSIWTCVIG